MPEETIHWLKNMHVDREKGEIRTSGTRNTIISSAGFRAYRDAISEVMGPGAADAVLYRAGKKHTKDFVKDMINDSMMAGFARRFSWGRNKITENVATILTQYGFGKAEIEKIDMDDETIVVLRNSAIATSYEKRQKGPVCAYIAGLLSGGGEAIAGGTYETTETHCLAKGDVYCRFIVKREKK